MTTEFKFR